jgi:RDD family
MTAIGAGPVPAVPARPARPVQGRPAGVVTRCAAAVVDLLVAAAVTVGGYLFVSGVLFLWETSAFHFPSISRGAALACDAAVLVVYLAAAWSLSGRTLGNNLLGLRVRGSGSMRLGPVRATIRALFYVAFPIGLLFCALGERRSSVQDRVLRTTVVYDW